MVNQSHERPEDLLPEEEVDLLLACGEVLLRASSGRFPSEHDDLLLFKLDLNGRPLYNYYVPSEVRPALRLPARGASQPCLFGPEHPPSILEAALKILARLREVAAPIVRLGALQNEHLAVLGMIACSATGLLLERVRGMPGLGGFLSLFEKRPSQWRAILNEAHRYCRQDDALLAYVRGHKARKSLGGLDAFTLSPRGRRMLRVDLDFEEDEQEAPEQKARPHWGEPADAGAIVHLRQRPLSLKDVVLPAELQRELEFVAAHCKSEGERAAPVLLFHGPPGTGKTHTGYALAGEIGRRLAVAAVPALLDCWVGVTEKNIAEAFGEARESGAVLFLDEADSLLASRSMARRGWEFALVNTLLACLEEPGVPVILCTNYLEAMDDALRRRIHHLLAFPMPGLDARRKIWRLAADAQGWPEELDLEGPSSVPLSGGLIANAVRHASLRHAVLGDAYPICAGNLLDLARAELIKLNAPDARRVVGFAPPCTAESFGGGYPETRRRL
jgi:hypothetical protein